MPILVKDGGLWKGAAPFIRTAGAWVQPSEVWNKVNGVWVKSFAAETLQTFDYVGTIVANSKTGDRTFTIAIGQPTVPLVPWLTYTPPSQAVGDGLEIICREGEPGSTNDLNDQAYLTLKWMKADNTSDSNFEPNASFIDAATTIQMIRDDTGAVIEAWNAVSSVGPFSSSLDYITGGGAWNPGSNTTVQNWDNPWPATGTTVTVRFSATLPA